MNIVRLIGSPKNNIVFFCEACTLSISTQSCTLKRFLKIMFLLLF